MKINHTHFIKLLLCQFQQIIQFLLLCVIISLELLEPFDTLLKPFYVLKPLFRYFLKQQKNKIQTKVNIFKYPDSKLNLLPKKKNHMFDLPYSYIYS